MSMACDYTIIIIIIGIPMLVGGAIRPVLMTFMFLDRIFPHQSHVGQTISSQPCRWAVVISIIPMSNFF